MAIYVEVNQVRYPAIITGRLHDHDWDDRESKAITIETSYENALATFVDDVDWAIVEELAVEHEVLNDQDEMVSEIGIEETVFDNSDYGIAGDIIDHRNGTVTVKMGKPTAAELLALLEEGLEI